MSGRIVARLRPLRPAPPRDVKATCADVEDLARQLAFSPHTPIERGVGRFIAWSRKFYRA